MVNLKIIMNKIGVVKSTIIIMSEIPVLMKSNLNAIMSLANSDIGIIEARGKIKDNNTIARLLLEEVERNSDSAYIKMV